MKNRITRNQFITKKDLHTVTKLIITEIVRHMRKKLDTFTNKILNKIHQVHTDIKPIRKDLRFLEREIIRNHLKIKELEERFTKYTLPETKSSN